jgi:hypothetical protein
VRRPPHIGNRLVSGFCLLSMSLASDPSSQMCLLVVSVVMDHCAAAVPNALIKHLACYPFTHHDGDHHEQHGNHHEEEMFECRVSTSLVTSSTHHSASGADRLFELGSLGLAIHPIGSEQEVSQSNRVLPCAQFRASPAGLSRSPTPQRTGDKTRRRVW